MNQGVGSALMKEALSFFKKEGYSRATLWVLDTNEKSRGWYEHKGWRVEGATKVEEKDGLKLREIRYVKEVS